MRWNCKLREVKNLLRENLKDIEYVFTDLIALISGAEYLVKKSSPGSVPCLFNNLMRNL